LRSMLKNWFSSAEVVMVFLFYFPNQKSRENYINI